MIPGKGPTDGLNDTTLTAEKVCLFHFSDYEKFCLSLRYNGACSYLFVYGVHIIKLKGKYSDIKETPLCLWKISNNLSGDIMKKTEFYGYVYDFSVDYDAIAVDDILNIHKYLMKKHNI